MEKAIEELARWMHEAYADTVYPVIPWDDLGEIAISHYRRVAERLLKDPPACLREAVLRTLYR